MGAAWGGTHASPFSPGPPLRAPLDGGSQGPRRARVPGPPRGLRERARQPRGPQKCPSRCERSSRRRLPAPRPGCLPRAAREFAGGGKVPGGPRPLTGPEDRRTPVALETGRGRPPPPGPLAHAPTATATSRRERGRGERARLARAASASEPGAACAPRRPRRVAAEVRAGPGRRRSFPPGQPRARRGPGTHLGPPGRGLRGPHVPSGTPAARPLLAPPLSRHFPLPAPRPRPRP